MKISDAKDQLKYVDVCQLTKRLEWGEHYFSTEALFKQIISASAHIAYIHDQDMLIGFGRILTDGMHCFFCDVGVHPDYQGKKIGTLIMQYLIDKVKDKKYVCLGLFCEEDNPSVEQFYRKLGFESSNAMELKRYLRQDWN